MATTNFENPSLKRSLESFVNEIYQWLADPKDSINHHHHHYHQTKNSCENKQEKNHSNNPSDARLLEAFKCVNQALQLFPLAYDLKILEHQIALKRGDITNATVIFDFIRERYPDHLPFKEYLARITRSVMSKSPDDNFAFFLKIPTRTQREVLLRTAIYYESISCYLEACKMFAFVFKTYQETTIYYGAHAAQLAIRCEREERLMIQPIPYRKHLAEEILPEILRNKVKVHSIQISPEIFIYQPSRLPPFVPFISTQINHPSHSSLHVTHDDLKLWLNSAQGYYISNKNWRKLFEISLTLLDTCGYLKLQSSAPTTLVDLFSNPYKLPQKLFNLIGQKQILEDPSALEFALSIAMACFVHCCYEFYEHVAGLKNTQPGGRKTCLIPFWPIPLFSSPPEISSNRATLTSSSSSSSSSSYSDSILSEDAIVGQPASKMRRLNGTAQISNNGEADVAKEKIYSPCLENSERKGKQKVRGTDVMKVKNLLIDDDTMADTEKNFESSPNSSSNTYSHSTLNDINGAHRSETDFGKCLEAEYELGDSEAKKALELLIRARNCWDLIEEMVSDHRGSNLDLVQDLNHQMKTWDLTSEIINSIMLTRAELNLLNSGSPQTSFKYYREICDEFTHAWDASRQPIIKNIENPILVSSHRHQRCPNDNFSKEKSAIEVQMSLMLPLRALYSIAMIYIKAHMWGEARAELRILLSGLPSTPMIAEHFEKDDWILTRKKEEVEKAQTSYNLMQVTQEELAVRVVKNLIWSYEREINSSNLFSSEAAVHQLIVLSQYGWPYWRGRLFRPIILPYIRKRGGLKYLQFFQNVQNIEIMKDIFELFQTSPDLELHLSPKIRGTTESIKALEANIQNNSSRSSTLLYSRSLVDIFKTTSAAERQRDR
ncbi:hypothetical protein G9A89_023114 [Geosiphon pyriformis]|nr:hypothetical protein G9A89_023114 [Geosiphon pyriformis]